MPRKYSPPEGRIIQAFTFALDPTDEQSIQIARFFGARRKAFNWTLDQIKTDLARYRETGESGTPPTFYGLRKRWNAQKNTVCVNQETGDVWWSEVSKEVFADGVRGATDAFWRWQQSRAGTIKGRTVGFPRFKKRGRDRDRLSFTTGPMRLEADRRHLTLPVLGTIRTHENTRRIERLIALDRAKVLSVTVSRQGDRVIAAVRVSVARPQQAGVAQSDSVVGVGVGVRRLATVATTTEVIGELANPRALEHRLSELAERLERGRTRKDRLGVEAEITRITKPRWVARVLTWTLSGTGPKDFALSFKVDEEAREQLEEELFGKRILFSDREDWSVADVVGAYRSQHHVESDFRQMKDRQVVSFSPVFHWTDQKIRVHVFYCVLALALAIAKLMVREVQQSGLEMSVREMLSSLAGIQETVLPYKAERGRPRARRMITEMDPTQQRLNDLFSLGTYAPKR